MRAQLDEDYQETLSRYSTRWSSSRNAARASRTWKREAAGPYDADWICVLMALYTVVRPVPMFVIIATEANAMKPASRAYSIRSWPSSSTV